MHHRHRRCIAADACLITVSDDGGGIADPVDLVSLGPSDWPDECRAREDPAGMGFFSLAGLDTVVSSRQRGRRRSRWRFTGDAWTGEADIDVLPFDGPRGTTIAFTFDRAGLTASSNAASRQPLRSFSAAVSYNGKDLAAPIFSPTRTRSSSGKASGSACSATGIRRTSPRSTSTG
jgi:hypothetical protein